MSEALRDALATELARGGADVQSLALHLGRQFALQGGSTLLVMQSIESLGPANDLAKAALVEGYTRGREELSRGQILSRLHTPLVDLEDGSEAYAVYCAYEPDDDVDISEWADGVVRELRKRGARRVFAGGADLATRKVREAAELVGIVATTTEAKAIALPSVPAQAERAFWRRFWPFRAGHGKE